MDSEDREKLDIVLKLAEKNNRVLRKIQASMRWSKIMSVVYWLVIAIIAIALYYYLQPYIKQVLDFYTEMSGGVDKLKALIPKGQ